MLHVDNFFFSASSILCALALSPVNGSLGYHSIPSLLGTYITYHCDDGLFPTGVMTSTCTDVGGRGEWVPDPAQLMCEEQLGKLYSNCLQFAVMTVTYCVHT